jgi:hypothetical protein
LSERAPAWIYFDIDPGCCAILCHAPPSARSSLEGLSLAVAMLLWFSRDHTASTLLLKCLI